MHSFVVTQTGLKFKLKQLMQYLNENIRFEMAFLHSQTSLFMVYFFKDRHRKKDIH